MVDLKRILKAHHETGKAVVLHGSSGYGKSGRLVEYAKANNLEIHEKRTCYTDPIEVMLPVKNDKEEVVDYYPSRWLMDLHREDGPPTMLFLDEFNRPASMQTFSMFTELLLDRRINGYKIRDNVLIVAACNLGDEDTGVVEIPDAVLKRVTNIPLVPTQTDMIQNMRCKEARKALTLNPKMLDYPATLDLDSLNGNPRQIDSVVELWNAKDENGEFILNPDDLGVIARGRIGIEKGNMLSTTLQQMRNDVQFKLPQVCKPSTFEKIAEIEDSGQVLEVVTMLKENVEHPASSKTARYVAEYLLRYAQPETVRAIHESQLLSFSFKKGEAPKDKNGNPFLDQRKNSPRFQQEIAETGLPWQMVAVFIGKLDLKSHNQDK